MTRRFLSLFAAFLLVVAVAGPAGADPLPVHCPDGSRIVVDEFSSDDAGTQVTATFTIPASCQDIKLTLATYAISPDGSQTALHASASATFDGGPDKRELTVAGPGCDQDVYLVVGQAKDDPASYGDNEIVDIGSDDTFGDCDGFDPPPSSSTTTTTTTTTTPTTSTTEAPAGEECPGGFPTNKLTFPADVFIEGETAVATFTIKPGCADVEISLVNFVTGRNGRVLGDTATGVFDAGTHTRALKVDLRPGCENQVHIIVGKPGPDIYKLINEGREFIGAADTTGDCAAGRPAAPTGSTHTGTLPFTGAGLFVPLLAGGVTLMVVGVVTVASARRGRRMPR